LALSQSLCGIFSKFYATNGIVYSITNTTLGINYLVYDNFKQCSLELNNNNKNYKNYKNYEINGRILVCANKNICNQEFVEYTNYFLIIGSVLCLILPTLLLVLFIFDIVKNYYFKTNEINETQTVMSNDDNDDYDDEIELQNIMTSNDCCEETNEKKEEIEKL
jgi:hypothetical protein